MSEVRVETQALAEMTPIQQGERIQILDILRGFAIFGILAVNITGFAAPIFWPGYMGHALLWYDDLAEKVIEFFFEAKFYTIFSFLFGLGFSVQLSRAAAKGRDIRSFYPRRLLILFVIGIFHAVLLWTGDILRLYALLGFALLAFRKRSSRTLLIWAGVFFAISFIMLGILGGQDGGSTPGIPGFDLPAMARVAYNSPSFWVMLTFQFFGALGVFFFLSFSQGPSVMALFLLGLLAGRLRIFENLAQHRQLAKQALIIGIVLGIAGNSLLVFSGNSWLKSLGMTIGAPALAAAYVSALSLISLRQGGSRLLSPLAQVGRMALTNYVLQSLVCSILFYGFGFGLYEQVGAAALLGITILIYLVQIPLSVWWLKRFQYGPLEWLWRSFTYRKWQPVLKQTRVDMKGGSLSTPAG